MNILSTLGSLMIVSVLVSALVQWLKQKLGGNNKALIILAVVSIVAGTAYFFLKQLTVWPVLLADIVTVLSFANAIYTVFIQWFENKSTVQQ